MDILICDDHRIFGDALTMVLTARSWRVVGVASDPAHAVEVVSRTNVDTCLMDLNFPEGTTGLQGIASIRATSPDTRVVVLTASNDPVLIMQAVQSGADAIVFKDDELDHIVEVVERTHASHGSPSRFARSSSAPQTIGTNSLTEREREVLQGLVDGKRGKELARHLGVAYSTVRSHVQNVLMKLGVHSQLEAVSYAIEQNLCEPHRRSAPRDASLF
jgi:two-component system nitrate/nitrite response regulator NarL